MGRIRAYQEIEIHLDDVDTVELIDELQRRSTAGYLDNNDYVSLFELGTEANSPMEIMPEWLLEIDIPKPNHLFDIYKIKCFFENMNSKSLEQIEYFFKNK